MSSKLFSKSFISPLSQSSIVSISNKNLIKQFLNFFNTMFNHLMVVIVVVLLSINRSLSRSTNTGYSNHYPVISHTYYFHIVTLPSSSYFQSLHIPCVTAQLQFPSWLQCLHGSLLFFILLISF